MSVFLIKTLVTHIHPFTFHLLPLRSQGLKIIKVLAELKSLVESAREVLKTPNKNQIVGKYMICKVLHNHTKAFVSLRTLYFINVDTANYFLWKSEEAVTFVQKGDLFYSTVFGYFHINIVKTRSKHNHKTQSFTSKHNHKSFSWCL